MLRDRDPHYTYGAEGIAVIKRISWGAIFAGALIAIVTMVLLNLLGAGIGFATISPTEEANPLEGLGTGAIIWWIASNLLSLFAGGYVAGRMSGFPKSSTGFLHGILSWCLFSLFSFYLLTSTVGWVLNGVGKALGQTASLAAEGIGAVLPDGQSGQNNQAQADNTIDQILMEARQILEGSGEPALNPDSLNQTGEELMQEGRETARNIAIRPGTLEAELRDFWQQVRQEGKQVLDAADRETLADILARQTDLSRQEAERVVDRWARTYENIQTTLQQEVNQLEQDGEQVLDDVTDAMAKAAIYSFIALLVGAIAAGFGGYLGVQRDVAVGANEGISRTDVER